mmetsp:Transcript_86260/g.229257  ORF Transcript_86260/g.229257 Transcript_86260/m.229257 type:complete len:267 (+) Transcript_86260:156-956(+)
MEPERGHELLGDDGQGLRAVGACKHLQRPLLALPGPELLRAIGIRDKLGLPLLAPAGRPLALGEVQVVDVLPLPFDPRGLLQPQRCRHFGRIPLQSLHSKDADDRPVLVEAARASPGHVHQLPLPPLLVELLVGRRLEHPLCMPGSKDAPLRGLEQATLRGLARLEEGHARVVLNEHLLYCPKRLDRKAVARHKDERVVRVSWSGHVGGMDGRVEKGKHRGDQVCAVLRGDRGDELQDVPPLDVLDALPVVLAVEEGLNRVAQLAP